MSASFKYDPAQLEREAVTGKIAAHIEAMLAVKGWRLVKGTPASVAKNMIRAWSPKAIRFFYVMSTQKDGFPSKSAAATALDWSHKSLHDFWCRTLKAAHIRVRHDDNAETKEAVFRRGRERRFNGSGISLYLGLEQPSYAAAMSIAEDTLDATLAFRDNMRGAFDAVEANDTLTEAEREAPRKMLAEREEAVVRGPQLSLVANDKK